MKSFLFLSFVLFSSFFLNAQVGIGTTTPSGALDITSTTDGLLIPRMALSGTSTVLPVLTATTSELVYNTATVADVTPGFYYLSSPLGPWSRLEGASGWLTTGNTGIVNGINFIGTGAATNIDVAFRRNNTDAGKLGATSTSFGVGALTNGAATNSTAIGNNALSISTASNNVAVGQSALQNSNSGQWNTAIGNSALAGINNSAAQNNTAVGYNAMANGTGNISNVVAIGANALLQNRANNTIAIGYNALQAQVAGGLGNTGVGYSVLNNNTGGDNNTALGNEAGFATTGSNNTYVGYFAGRFPGSSSNNTYIGYQAGVGTTGSNNILIGSGVTGTIASSYQIVLGAGSTASTAYVNAPAWNFSSDKRLKSDIKDSQLGIDFLKNHTTCILLS